MLLIHREEMTEGFGESANRSYHGDNTSATMGTDIHLEATNSRITEAEDRISELEDRMVEMNQDKRKTN